MLQWLYSGRGYTLHDQVAVGSITNSECGFLPLFLSFNSGVSFTIGSLSKVLVNCKKVFALQYPYGPTYLISRDWAKN